MPAVFVRITQTNFPCETTGCGHPIIKHGTMEMDPETIPCTEEGCECTAYRNQEFADLVRDDPDIRDPAPPE